MHKDGNYFVDIDILKIIQAKDPNTVMTNKTLHLRHKVDVSTRNQCCGTGGMV